MKEMIIDIGLSFGRFSKESICSLQNYRPNGYWNFETVPKQDPATPIQVQHMLTIWRVDLGVLELFAKTFQLVMVSQKLYHIIYLLIRFENGIVR